MTIFHFKAIIKEILNTDECIYKYWPDCVMAKDIIGEFIIRSDNFEPIILITTYAEEKGLVSTDKRCVLELSYKIKKIHNEIGKFPDEVIRIS